MTLNVRSCGVSRPSVTHRYEPWPYDNGAAAITITRSNWHVACGTMHHRATVR
jgi:hypothetical protein